MCITPPLLPPAVGDNGAVAGYHGDGQCGHLQFRAPHPTHLQRRGAVRAFLTGSQEGRNTHHSKVYYFQNHKFRLRLVLETWTRD